MNYVDRLYEIICAFDNEIFHEELGQLGEVQFKFEGVNLARTLDVKGQIENKKPYINATVATHMFFTYSCENFVQDFLIDIDRSLFSENLGIVKHHKNQRIIKNKNEYFSLQNH